jgi:hypothetical protein
LCYASNRCGRVRQPERGDPAQLILAGGLGPEEGGVEKLGARLSLMKEKGQQGHQPWHGRYPLKRRGKRRGGGRGGGR